MRRQAAAVLLALLVPAGGWAQQRPALTEDPVPVPAGHLRLDAGTEFGTDVYFPASGLGGDLWTLGIFDVRVGLGSMVEVQVAATAWKTLGIDSRDPAPPLPAPEAEGARTGGGGDVAVATKVRVWGEAGRRPALAVRFATRLPVASDGSGLNLDTTDFYAALLAGKTVWRTRVAANLGVGILADPTRADRQNDVLTYGLSVARDIGSRTAVVVDLHGRVSVRTAADTPPGTGSAGTVRAGIRLRAGKAHLDAAAVVGLNELGPDIGITFGYSLLLPAFDVP